jgi:MFS family permease
MSKKAREALFIGLLCAVSYLAVYVARNVLSTVTPQMVESGEFTKEYIGNVSSLFFTFYAIGQLLNGFLGEKIFTTTFSNLGVVSLPSEFSGYVESMDCCLGPQTTNRLACTAVSCGGVSTFTISKMTADRTFEERMYKLLTDDGLEVSVEGSEYYDR